MAASTSSGLFARAGSPAKITSPYNSPAASSSVLRSSGRLISAWTKRPSFSNSRARASFARYPIMSLAPVAASSSVEAEPTPPDPPTRINSLPSSESDNRRLLLRRHIPAGSHHQKHRQDFAIAEIVFKKTRDHQGQGSRDCSMQNESPIASARREALHGFPKVGEHHQEHPHDHEHRRYAALRCVLQVEVVQVPVPAARQWIRRIRRNVAF